jgi:hypothetical protein
MKSLEQLKTKLLKNPQTRAEYDAMADEFETVRELIAARTLAGLKQSDAALTSLCCVNTCPQGARR